MGYLKDEYKTWTIEQLKAEKMLIEYKIENNDGRLTAGSSADLDYNFDKIDTIIETLKERKKMKRKAKVVAIIQARMNPRGRLPGKVLLPLGSNDKSALWWISTRAGLAKLVDEVVIAMPDEMANDPIKSKYLTDQNWRMGCTNLYNYKGHEDDVIGRALAAAKWSDANIIVDLTADCPLVDPKHIDHLIQTLLTEDLEYVSNCVWRDWPDGADIQVYWTRTLERCKERYNPKNHVGWNIAQHPETFDIHHWQAPYHSNAFFADESMHWPELGLTLDAPEDYELLKIIFNSFGHQIDFSIESVVRYLRKNPHLIKINQMVRRKKPEEG